MDCKGGGRSSVIQNGLHQWSSKNPGSRIITTYTFGVSPSGRWYVDVDLALQIRSIYYGSC